MTTWKFVALKQTRETKALNKWENTYEEKKNSKHSSRVDSEWMLCKIDYF